MGQIRNEKEKGEKKQNKMCTTKNKVRSTHNTTTTTCEYGSKCKKLEHTRSTTTCPMSVSSTLDFYFLVEI